MDLQRKVDKMKAYIYLILNLLISVITVSANAAFTYDSSTKVLEDDIWRFEGVSLDKDGVTLGVVKGAMAKKKPETPQPLDFSDVKDINGKALKVVTIGVFANFCISEVNAPECTVLSGGGCFNGCTSLRKVILNSAFNDFGGARAFSGCTSLEEFEPRTLLVTEVTGYAFSSCEKLSGTFDLPNCTSIGLSAFSGCKLLTSVVAPNVTEIIDGAFSGCSSMSEIRISSVVGKNVYKDIFPGANVYMADEVPESLGLGFIGNLTGPFPKLICSNKNLNDCLDKIKVNHHVILKKQFNTDLGQEFEYKEGNYRSWETIAKKMASDTLMCEFDGKDKISLKKEISKSVIAFVLQKSTNTKLDQLVSFWIIKSPNEGFKVIVR